MIKGLGKDKLPFKSLDDWCPTVDWHKLHAEVSLGVAKSKWVKRFVSVGVHPDWENQEIATHIRTVNISDYEKLLYQQIEEFDTETKLKYFMCITDSPHPFWSCFLRLNKPIERTRMANKSVAKDCTWTDDAKNFPSLIELINQMPFEEIGRVMIFITEANNNTVPHFDSTLDNQQRPNDDFIWFQTRDDYKPIYVMDGETKEKFYPPKDKKFLWFNEMDYHGTDPVPKFSFSIRIDGVFKQEIKDMLLDFSDK